MPVTTRHRNAAAADCSHNHDTPHVTAIEPDLWRVAITRRFAAADVLQGLLHTGATIKRNDKQKAIGTFSGRHEWLLAEARNSVSIQRGLGEMNPAAVETTMDPNARRLLKVQIEDAIVGGDLPR